MPDFALHTSWASWAAATVNAGLAREAAEAGLAREARTASPPLRALPALPAPAPIPAVASVLSRLAGEARFAGSGIPAGPARGPSDTRVAWTACTLGTGRASSPTRTALLLEGVDLLLKDLLVLLDRGQAHELLKSHQLRLIFYGQHGRMEAWIVFLFREHFLCVICPKLLGPG
jgi:hypothetical protein